MNCALQEEAIITFQASDMQLFIHAIQCLGMKNAQSRARGHHFLKDNVHSPPHNGAILDIAYIMKAVMSSAADSKLGAAYIDVYEAVVERIISKELDHPQPYTLINTDNSTAKFRMEHDTCLTTSSETCPWQGYVPSNHDNRNILAHTL